VITDSDPDSGTDSDPDSDTDSDPDSDPDSDTLTQQSFQCRSLTTCKKLLCPAGDIAGIRGFSSGVPEIETCCAVFGRSVWDADRESTCRT
jgi:hypothetical protein